MAPELLPTPVHDIMHPKSEFLYKATDVIYKLLKVIGAEVCAFRRHHQVAFRLVEYARDLYDAINNRIYRVETENSWEDYEIYTQAIDPLEEILLQIIPVVFNEQDLDHLNASSWAEYVRITGQWHQNRSAIRERFQDMRAKPQFQALMSIPKGGEDDILDAFTLDDLSHLDYLLGVIGENVQQIVEPQVKKYVEKVAELNVLPIQCGHLASRMVVVMVNESVPKDVRDRLISDTSLWGTLAQLIVDIYSFMASQLIPEDSGQVLELITETEISITINQFTERYNKVVEMADKVPVPPVIEIPQAYSRLLPLVGRIDRRALNQTIAALEAAGQDAGSGRSSPADKCNITDELKGYNRTDDSTLNCAHLYERSADELMTCFRAMEMSCDIEHGEKLRQARSKDDSRVAEANKKINKYEHPCTIGVAVGVYENTQNGQKAAELFFASIPSTARLEYIKYLVGRQLEGRASAQTGHFEQADSGDQPTVLSLDLEVKAAINDRGTVVFILHR